MKVALVWSSPNKDGITASAKNKALEGLKKAGADIEEIHVNSLDLKVCKACGNGWGNCEKEGICILKDDFQKTYEKIVEADRIIFVTAVYWHDITECLKVFIDRMRRCERRHNHYLEGKKVMIVTCAGGTGKGVTRCIELLEYSLKHMRMDTVERIPVIRFNKDYMVPIIKDAAEKFALASFE